MKTVLVVVLLIISCFQSTVFAWSNDEFEIFDLVEEINRNFYELMDVKQEATHTEIKRAFRTLSVALHPDKNSAEDANVQFRNLVSVYEVLKDPTKRETYDNVLKNGLPNWKSAMYYYRRVHKMGLAEMAALLFAILTVGGYIIAWAVYLEKKFTAESMLGPKLKKLQRKNKGVDLDTILNSIPTPSLWDLLPFQIVRGIYYTPSAIKNIYTDYVDYKRIQDEETQRELEKIEKQKQLEEEIAKQREARKEGVRKRKPVFKAEEKSEEELKGYSKLKLPEGTKIKAVESKEPTVAGGLWTDDDFNELIRLVKKYPNGTLSRWEVIAEQMRRSVPEVTFMAAKMKETGYTFRGNADQDSVAEAIVQDSGKKTKQKVTTGKATDSKWTQEQQKQLENAIVTYSKSTAGDRWQKIANAVPGKTKEECLARYKYLVEKVKAQKAMEVANNQAGGEANKYNEETEPKATQEEDLEADGELKNVQKSNDNEQENISDEIPAKPKGGKPRNKRKLKKQQMDFSSDEDDVDE